MSETQSVEEQFLAEIRETRFEDRGTLAQQKAFEDAAKACAAIVSSLESERDGLKAEVERLKKEQREVFIVEVSAGDYEDYRSWVIAIFSTKDAAIELATEYTAQRGKEANIELPDYTEGWTEQEYQSWIELSATKTEGLDFRGARVITMLLDRFPSPTTTTTEK